MTAMVRKIEETVLDFFMKYRKYILFSFVMGILTYFMMMAQNLVNDLDGIWHLSNFIAGDWEISLGRGLQRYADRARFGIVSDPFNSMITLLLVAIANAMVLMRFHFDSTVYKGLFLTILIANPVICNSLSYSYMSVNFGLAYLFGVVSFCCIKGHADKKRWIGIVCGGISLGISLAFYQAYICVASILMLMFILKMLSEKVNIKEVFGYIGACACVVISGGVIYLVITKALLFRAGIQMASYKGASNADLLSMVKNLPQSIKQYYVQFWDYFSSAKAFSDLEFIDIVLVALLFVYLSAAVIQFIKLFKHNKGMSFLFLSMLILLPVAGCSVLLLAVGNSMSVLMSMGLVMSIVMLGIIVPKDGNIGFWLKRVHLLFLIVFAWFQLSAVTNDQLALKEGKTATITLTENIMDYLYEAGYPEEYQTVALVGRPANNDGFAQSTAYHMANAYAKFGCWSVDARNNRVSWSGVISNFLGVNINLCADTEYQEIVALEQVAEMPEFPAEGSIRVINDTLVVKVSDVY